MAAPSSPTVTLFTEQEVAGRIAELASSIASQSPPDLMVVALLRGSFMFTADLVRALHHHGVRPQIDFLTLGSYGTGVQSSGAVTIYRDLRESVAGRDVLIVDDILESGRTLSYARDLVSERGSRSVKLAVLLEKPGKRAVDIQADFVGFTVPDRFVVGYGLDYQNYYRELPYIGMVEV